VRKSCANARKRKSGFCSGVSCGAPTRPLVTMPLPLPSLKPFRVLAVLARLRARWRSPTSRSMGQDCRGATSESSDQWVTNLEYSGYSAVHDPSIQPENARRGSGPGPSAG
jgi:hypothetical protein